MKVRNVIISFMVASLAGCSMGHRDPVEIKQTLDQSINENGGQLLIDLPASVQADLMPDLNAPSIEIDEPVKRFRVKANGVSAKAFFTSLVKGTEYSVVIHPKVSGRITMNINDVTLDEVLSSVEDLYGYEIVKSDKILQVYPATIRTETIPIDYLQLTRKGRSLTTITTGSITNSDGSSSSSNSDSSSSATGGTEIETTSESDFWTELEKAVSVMIGNGSDRSVVTSPQASVITITASPDELRKVKQFLGVSHKRLQRQVILEAKLLEVTLSDGYQQGINWSSLTGSIGGTNIIFGQTPGTTGDILPGMDAIGTLLGGQTNITVSDGNFSAVLRFMDTQGDLNVLSSPRVTAANNQKAVIKVGRDEYFVTEVSSVTGSGDNSNASPEVTLTPFFSGISLDVTPQIDDKGNVMLHVHPSVINVETEIKEIDLGDVGGVLQLPLAKSSIRESDSVIRAKSGDVVVIGGLMKSQTVDQVSKVPFLGDIPALGHLFRNVSQLTQKTELVILLKPTVVGVDTWQEELERSRDLLQEWFPEE
ncbi:pilus (MSHA type) biogenesis protein MshL [Aliivibrio sp. S3MY1]|uniref:pilus (MSHA type) biogenesis protein MshL n=1 Tax=unclassified Aliivibrio TaxID=2645654 RepID=UPI002378AEFD|nr:MULTISPECIES: pilus (MSHA type) biogenesis protein MshL [unclassified Aliivibrio]MDD9197094.1 pilus (MSHA type) biogenesis protein MshL [Aliivibrio sp. S3MY1]MDD9200239.1 pilus (MSHA type) biogenesis protein MshL [Aliivibrio sp. S2MY1]